MFDLTGKTALVTGATRRHRRGDRRARFIAQGAAVALSGTRREALDELAGEFKRARPCVALQPRRQDAVEELVPKAEAAMGQLDILVANAGITRDNLLVQLSDEAWDEVVAVNLTATFRLARAAVRGMMRRRFGRVIGISSVVGCDRQSGSDQLHRHQGRHDRHDQIDRAGIRQARSHGELHRPGLHRHGHDRQAQ